MNNVEWIFWTLIGGLFVYEGVTLWITRKPDDHITAIIRRMTKDNPLLPFMFGLLMGHFFW